jgi:predicted nucleic acid-binding protein
MKIVVDVNVLLSALIRDSTTRKIIRKSELDFYFPEPSLHKIRKYKSYILEKSGLTEQEFTEILANLFKYIHLVPEEEIKRKWQEAKEIMEKIDSEDVIFVATALSLPELIIWSEDKDFDKQKRVKSIKTEEIIRFLSLRQTDL